MLEEAATGIDFTGAAQYLRTQGHCALRGLLTMAEVEALRPVLLDAASRKAGKTVTNKGTSGKPFTRVHNLWRESPAVRAISLSPRLASAASHLLGVSKVRLYQDSLFIKQSGELSLTLPLFYLLLLASRSRACTL